MGKLLGEVQTLGASAVCGSLMNDKTVDEAEHVRGEFVDLTFGVAPFALSHPKNAVLCKKFCLVQQLGVGKKV